MSLPLISVLIPTYNVAPFVEEAILSIINQSYTNLEIIIVDDCSVDETYSILQRLAGEDNRLRLFRNATNQRIAKTLNFAVSQARGEFYARMDGDDISLPEKIEKQLNFLLENPDVALVGTSMQVIDELGRPIHVEKYLTEHEDLKKVSEYVSPVPHIWLARASLYTQLGGYRIPPAEDLDFLLRAIDAGFRLANLPEPLYLLRQRQGNTATSLGLYQIRSIAYARRLHADRIRNKSMEDCYTEDNWSAALKTTDFERKRFEIAARFHFKYVLAKNQNRALALLYRTLSVLVSPIYQLQTIFNRWQYKRIVKKNRGYNPR